MKIKQKLIRILGGVPREEYEKHERARLECERQITELEREYGLLTTQYEQVERRRLPCKYGEEVLIIRNHNNENAKIIGKVARMYYLPDMTMMILCKQWDNVMPVKSDYREVE